MSEISKHKYSLSTWAMMPQTPSTPRNLISGAGGWLAVAPFQKTIWTTPAPARVSALWPPDAMMSREDVELYSPCTLLQVYTELALCSGERIEFDSMNASYISDLILSYYDSQGHIRSHLCSLFTWIGREEAEQKALLSDFVRN